MRRPGTTTMPVGGVRPADPTPAEPADLVIRNGNITTIDPALPAASAVAIRDGRFIAVGDDADIVPHIGPATQVIDVHGRRVIPGLNDSHLHVIRGGLNYVMELRWDGVRSLKQALDMLREQAARTPKGQWVRVVGGWTADQFVERRMPTLAEINAAAPDTPVFVLHLYQSALLNRAALKAAGIDRDTPDPAGGQIVRGRGGEPTGMLLASPSAAILYQTLAKGPTLSGDDKLTSTRAFLRELNRFGLTSAIDAAGGFQNFPDDYATVVELAKTGELTLRIAYHLFPQKAGQELDDLRRWATMVKPGDGDEWLRFNGAGENLAWAPADFENFAEPRPQLAPDAGDQLEAALRILIENGWGFRLHATYDETIGLDLDVFERLRAAGEWPADMPWLFDHAETVTPHNLDRIADLGGKLSIQNRMMFQGQLFMDRYGTEASRNTPPIARMLDAGLHVAAGTDATRVSSYNPWLSLAWLVTGRTIGGYLLYPRDNRVSREKALEMYTSAGPVLTGEQDIKGRIRPGMLADLAVLDADYFTVPDTAIADIESVLTVVGGRVVYAAGDFEPMEDAGVIGVAGRAGGAGNAAGIEPAWSPVAEFGGYHREPGGFRQAVAITEAAADSADQLAWRIHKGGVSPMDHTVDLLDDGCF